MTSRSTASARRSAASSHELSPTACSRGIGPPLNGRRPPSSTRAWYRGSAGRKCRQLGPQRDLRPQRRNRQATGVQVPEVRNVDRCRVELGGTSDGCGQLVAGPVADRERVLPVRESVWPHATWRPSTGGISALIRGILGTTPVEFACSRSPIVVVARVDDRRESRVACSGPKGQVGWPMSSTVVSASTDLRTVRLPRACLDYDSTC